MGANCSTATKTFLTAGRNGDFELILQECLKDMSLLCRSEWLGSGKTIWHVAAEAGQLVVLKTLVALVLQGPSGPSDWKQLLHLGKSTTQILGKLLNQHDARNQTPLHSACIGGHASCVEFLVDNGADPWYADWMGARNALHYAASLGHAACIHAILSRDAPNPGMRHLQPPNTSTTRLVDVLTLFSFSPLHYAAHANQAEAAAMLISHGADITLRSSHRSMGPITAAPRSTPLHLAAEQGHVAVARILLCAYAETMSWPEAGGGHPPRYRHDPRTLLDSAGEVPFHIARRHENEVLQEMLHPSLPLAFIFSNDDFIASPTRMFGAPRLAVLAARALHLKLVADVDRILLNTPTSTTAIPPTPPPPSPMRPPPSPSPQPAPPAASAKAGSPATTATACCQGAAGELGVPGVPGVPASAALGGVQAVEGGGEQKGGGAVHAQGAQGGDAADVLPPSDQRVGLEEGGQGASSCAVAAAHEGAVEASSGVPTVVDTAGERGELGGGGMAADMDMRPAGAETNGCAAAASDDAVGGGDGFVVGAEEGAAVVRLRPFRSPFATWKGGADAEGPQEGGGPVLPPGPTLLEAMLSIPLPHHLPPELSLARAPTAHQRRALQRAVTSASVRGGQEWRGSLQIDVRPTESGAHPEAMLGSSLSLILGRAQQRQQAQAAEEEEEEDTTAFRAEYRRLRLALGVPATQVQLPHPTPPQDAPPAAPSSATPAVPPAARPSSQQQSSKGGVSSGLRLLQRSLTRSSSHAAAEAAEGQAGALAPQASSALEPEVAQRLQRMASYASCRSLRRMMSVGGLAPGGGDVGSEDCPPNECEICFDADVAVQVVNCGHRLCGDCARELCSMHHFRPALCPFCRGLILGFTPTPLQ